MAKVLWVLNNADCLSEEVPPIDSLHGREVMNMMDRTVATVISIVHGLSGC